jgi:hypothetical protein
LPAPTTAIISARGGNSLKCDPQAVPRDLYRGYYMIGDAENLFGVVIAEGKLTTPRLRY